jgi:tetratricopeptide (TPR) repeat protein
MNDLSKMPTPMAVREQVARICKSLLSKKQKALLWYIVEEVLAGREVSGISIGEGFYGYPIERLRPEDGPDGKDKRPSNVRRGVGLLANNVDLYYRGSGRADFVKITFPKGSHAPIITARFEDLSEKSREKLLRAMEAREKRTATGYAAAISYFHEILAEKVDYAEILGRLAEVHAMRVLHSIVPPRSEMHLAQAYAQKALEKSDAIWEAHVVIGAYEACINRNWKSAETAFMAAVEIAGSQAKALPWFITYYNAQGRGEELIEYLRDYITQVSDAGPLIRRNLATALMLCGRFDEALREYQSAFPHYLAHAYAAMIYAALGDYSRVVEQARRAEEQPDSQYRSQGLLILGLAKTGRVKDASARLAALESRREYVSHFEKAIAYLGFDDYELVLDHLEKGSEEREYLLLFLPYWPMFQAIRQHPRFKSLVDKMNFPKRT